MNTGFDRSWPLTKTVAISFFVLGMGIAHTDSVDPPVSSFDVPRKIEAVELIGSPDVDPSKAEAPATSDNGMRGEANLPAEASLPPQESDAASDPVIAYLWSVYQRSPTKRDGHGDFTWKDRAAAEHVGMSVQDYVIGGIHPDFREQLYHAGLAMDLAGIPWTILSGFRDDYRQEIAVGLKAHLGNSFHGGSVATGGYGHGCAADIASIDGASNQQVWQWLAIHGAEFGLRRPLAAIDPAHVQPLGSWHEFAGALRRHRTGQDALETAPRQKEGSIAAEAGATASEESPLNPGEPCTRTGLRPKPDKPAASVGPSEMAAPSRSPSRDAAFHRLKVPDNARAKDTAVDLVLDASVRSKISPTPDRLGRTWFIQLTDGATEAVVRGAYYRMQRKFGRILGPHRPLIGRQGGARARGYTARIAVDTRATADKLCANLRSAGGDCLVSPR
jgi:hypothetical protein